MINTKTLKFFGDKNQLKNSVSKAKKTCRVNFRYNTASKFSDTKIKFFFDEKNKDGIESVIAAIESELCGVYAKENITLSQALFNLLKDTNTKISVAESFTGGKVVSDIVKNSGASAYVIEGIVAYSNESKIKRLGVLKDDINIKGAVSEEIAKEMAKGLLDTGMCDIAISTTGLAGPKSDSSGKPVGLCYIGVGDSTGVKAFELNLKGTREEITETGKNYALFLAIQNLKNKR